MNELANFATKFGTSVCGQSFVKSTVTCLPKTLQRNSWNQSFRVQCWTSALPSSVAIFPLLINIRPVNQSGSPANRNFASLRRLKNTKKHRMLAGHISITLVRKVGKLQRISYSNFNWCWNVVPSAHIDLLSCVYLYSNITVQRLKLRFLLGSRLIIQNPSAQISINLDKNVEHWLLSSFQTMFIFY
jgi:hypothetical protein